MLANLPQWEGAPTVSGGAALSMRASSAMRIIAFVATACVASAYHIPVQSRAHRAVPIKSAISRAPAPQLVLAPTAFDPAVAAAVNARMLFVGTFLPLVTAAVTTRGSTGVPSLVRSLNRKEPPPATNVGDSLVYLSRIVYHLRMGYAISMWNELLLLLGQNVASTALLHRFCDKRRPTALLCLARDLGLLLLAAVAMARIPTKWLPLLCLWTVPLALVSYGKQALQVAARGCIAPGPATSAVLLRWISSLVRVGTTTIFLAGDKAVMANHLLGLGGCTLLLGQMQWYAGLGPSRLATRKALYSQLFGKQRTLPDRSRLSKLPDFNWSSIGPFGFDDQPQAQGDSELADLNTYPTALFSEGTLRKAFAALDTDEDGVIATDDLVDAIKQATEASGTACNVEMVSAMIKLGDTNNDGVIDFEEYRRIIAADPGLLSQKFDPPLAPRRA